MTHEIITLAGAVWDHAEIEAVNEVLAKHGRLRMGRRTVEMERRVAALLGKRHGVMLNSGSSALELGVRLLALPAGSEVITPPLTFSTTVAPLVRAGLVPAFVDVEPETYCIDPGQIEAMLSERTRAMVIPNLIGNVPDWDRLRAIADAHDLLLVEDSCDTLGATLRGTPPGARAHVSATSFNESHIVTCGGTGGLVAVDDEALDQEARLLRNWGRSSSRYGAGPQHWKGEEGDAFDVDLGDATLGPVPYHRDFVFERQGFNLEGCELLSAFGLAQLDKLEAFRMARHIHFGAHDDFFREHEEHFVLPRELDEVETAWMSYPITVRPEAPFTREELHAHLEAQGIISRPIWTGNILRHPGFAKIAHRATPEGYSAADAVLRGGLLVAAHHGLADTHVARIHEAFTAFLAR